MSDNNDLHLGTVTISRYLPAAGGEDYIILEATDGSGEPLRLSEQIMILELGRINTTAEYLGIDNTDEDDDE